jgi:hypothetical protein
MTSEWAGPAVKTTGAGETVQFNVSMAEDQRSYQSLGIFSADQT